MADVGIVIHVGRTHRRSDASWRKGPYPPAAFTDSRLGSHEVGAGTFVDVDDGESRCTHGSVSCPDSFGGWHRRRTVRHVVGSDRAAGGVHVALADTPVSSHRISRAEAPQRAGGNSLEGHTGRASSSRSLSTSTDKPVARKRET